MTERKHSYITTRELVMYAALAAIMIASKEALAWLPNIELVTTLCIVYAAVLGVRALFPLYVFVLVEILLYGLGLWCFCYLYIWAIPVVVVLVLRKQESIVQNIIVMTAVSGIFGLLFGALSAIPTFVIGGWSTAWSYFIAGITYDIGHCLGNVLTTALLYKPLLKLMGKCNQLMEVT